ncbi:MAG TPA: LytTR family DNA-binding domain-containing protein [Candidatus Binatia bacterium]|nr:LytTR family DNA-binding domain-containing protein [Candidatus Binatia bacterium]
MIRTVVVDDEQLARDRVKSFLKKIPDVQLVGEAGDGTAAIELIETQQPDLVVLDVQMPGVDGFSVLRGLKEPPHVIFATAFDEYAIKAFEVEALDYLLKPFSQARLSEAVGRVRQRIDDGRARSDPAAIARAAEPRRAYALQIPVHTARKILVLSVKEILWFSVESRLVYAHVDGRAYMTNFTLRELEERLDPQVFFRAHKSRLVNLEQVKEIARWFGGRYRLVMKDSQSSQVELSRVQARELRARLGW